MVGPAAARRMLHTGCCTLAAATQCRFLPCALLPLLQRMETNVATAVANAALGCLCLWRGFSKDSGVSTVATTTTAGKGKWVGATDALLVG